MNVDDTVKLILVLSLAFSLTGITVQIIRLFNVLIDTTRLASSIVKSASTLVSKVTDDYDYISEQIKMIIDAITKFINTVFVPMSKFFNVFSRFGGMSGKSKTGKKKQEDEDEDMDEESEDE